MNIERDYARTLTAKQLESMSDEQIEKTVPRRWLAFYPGKDIVEGSWTFYLYDGMVYNLMTKRIESE
jgi:hypothetical protein